MENKSSPQKNKLLALGTFLVVFVIVCFLALFYASKNINWSSLLQDSQTPEENYIVTKVVDGDTIEVTRDNESFTIRYIGIDTPETVQPNTPVQCFGQKASDFNKELVLNKKVSLEKDVSDEDRFGRKLRYVYLEEGENSGKMVNEILIQEGYARVDTFPPDVKYVEKFQQQEKLARQNNLGLWKECEINRFDTSINLYKYMQNVPV